MLRFTNRLTVILAADLH